MRLTAKEKDLLRYLVKKELKEFKKEEAEIRPNLVFLKGEEEYDLLLEALFKKLK